MNQEHRRQFARFALKQGKGRRYVPDDEPTRWRPGNVTNPELLEPFTEEAAWELIAQRLLDDSQVIRETTLHKGKAAGKIAYEIVCPLGSKNLYIKFRQGCGASILGLSFHYENE